MLLAPVVWLALFGLNLLLCWSREAHELIAGVVLSTVVTAFVLGWHRVRARDLLVRPRPRVLLSPLPRLLSESWRVGRTLAGVALRGSPPDAPVGTVSSQPFREGGRDRSDAGRRALVVLSGSVTPNGYALAVPEGKDRIVLHRLCPEPPDADVEWPA